MKKEKLYQPTLASYAVMKSLSDSNDYQNSYEMNIPHNIDHLQRSN